MTDKRADQINSDWKAAQSDAQLNPSTLIEIVRLLARRAAERDFKHYKEVQERQGFDD